MLGAASLLVALLPVIMCSPLAELSKCLPHLRSEPVLAWWPSSLTPWPVEHHLRCKQQQTYDLAIVVLSGSLWMQAMA